MHGGFGVALAPDDDVRALGIHEGNEGGQELWGDVAVGVKKAQVPAGAQRKAPSESMSLANVRGIGNASDNVFGKIIQGMWTAVGRSVRDRDDLEGHL